MTLALFIIATLAASAAAFGGGWLACLWRASDQGLADVLAERGYSVHTGGCEEWVGQ